MNYWPSGIRLKYCSHERSCGHFQQHFNYILAISFIGGGHRSSPWKLPTCRNSLPNYRPAATHWQNYRPAATHWQTLPTCRNSLTNFIDLPQLTDKLYRPAATHSQTLSTCRNSLTNFIAKCCIEYTSPSAGFELTSNMHWYQDVEQWTINKYNIGSIFIKL